MLSVNLKNCQILRKLLFFRFCGFISTSPKHNKMENFLKYLSVSKKTFLNGSYQHLHLVLGNESCDLDSTISPIALAYLLSICKFIPIPNDAVVLPILNISEEDFRTKTENNFLLKQFNITLDSLTFRNEINLDDIIGKKNVTASLVDHHMLTVKDLPLKDSVIQVYDHRPIDPDMKWNMEKVNVKIQEVGSCATLISDIFLKTDEKSMCYELAYLLYATIVYDTVALKPENGRAKDLDLEIAKKLENTFQFSKDRDALFAEIRKAHMDVSHLTPKQLILRDLKVVNDVPVPGLPMLVEDFLKLNDTYEEIQKFSESFKYKTVVLIGLDARDKVKRDVAIFWKDDEKMKDLLLHNLKNAEKLKGYSFCFSEVSISYKNITCLRQGNIKLSRKQIIPLIKDAIVGASVS